MQIYRKEVDVGIYVTTAVSSHWKSKMYSVLLELNNWFTAAGNCLSCVPKPVLLS